MKSRISSFNPTVFRKDLTRFAPAWGAYLIVLILVLISMSDISYSYYRVQNVQTAINLMAWANLIYAAVVAQFLFGDLYNSRLCNALHALPVTRDGWFGTHAASGLVFSALPNLVIALLALPVLRLDVGWSAAFWWLLASELQYLFFFGVAVLCVMLAGNRLGQLALYAMINLAGLAAFWLASSIYEPRLYGIMIPEGPFILFCPLAQLSQNSDYFAMDYEEVRDAFDNFMYYELYGVAPGEGWGYMAVCAGIGILALVGALVLYRKRRLECAGDFMAFAKTEPAVLVLVTIFAGGFFHLFGDVFGMNMKYILIFCGMVVGYFACRMLMKRTTRVFQMKAFLGCGAIMVTFALTLALTAWDPAGITRYMPEKDEIQSIRFSNGYTLNRHGEYLCEVEDAADIEALMSVHTDCIDRSANTIRDTSEEAYSHISIRLEYTLKNGRTVNRFYDVHPLSKAGQVLKGYFTTPECVLGFPAEQAPEMVDYIRSIYVDGMRTEEMNLAELDLEGMLEAIIADCEAGNMVQFSGYHHPSNYDYDLLNKEYDTAVAYLEIGWDHEKLETAMLGNSASYGIISYSSLRVYRSCENTLRWMEENDLLTEDQRNELGGVTATFTTG